MKIGFELDGLISSPINKLTDLAEIATQLPIEGAREILNELSALGHGIVIYTKRDVSTALETERWLDKNKIPYDQIIFNRPNNMNLFFAENVRQFTGWGDVKSEFLNAGIFKAPLLPSGGNATTGTSTGEEQKL